MAIKQRKKKIIFTDLDETLLKKNQYYYRTLNNFITKLLRCEYLIIPVTSKTYTEVINLLKLIRFQIPFSVENGGAYYIPIKNNKYYLYKKVLNPHALNAKTIKKILTKNIFKKHLSNVEFIENLSFANQKIITKLNDNQLEDFNAREYTIPVLWHGTNDLKKKFEESLFKHNLKLTFGGKLYNISGLHSKADSINYFTSYYKRKFKNKKLITISIGDSQNDIEILNNSNYSGIIKSNTYRITNIEKKNNIFRSFTQPPHGWVEILKKIIVKMERDYN